MARFPQMWAAAILLNGRLLRENALQGAEQLGEEIVRGLQWVALFLQGTGRHLLQGSVSGTLAGPEGKGSDPQEGSIFSLPSCPWLTPQPWPAPRAAW